MPVVGIAAAVEVIVVVVVLWAVAVAVVEAAEDNLPICVFKIQNKITKAVFSEGLFVSYELVE